MYLHDPGAERALIMSVTDDADFADAVAAVRGTRPTGGGGWLELTAPGIVARTERHATDLCAEILDLHGLAARLRCNERPELAAGTREVVRAAHVAYVACHRLSPVAERADAMEELTA